MVKMQTTGTRLGGSRRLEVFVEEGEDGFIDFRAAGIDGRSGLGGETVASVFDDEELVGHASPGQSRVEGNRLPDRHRAVGVAVDEEHGWIAGLDVEKGAAAFPEVRILTTACTALLTPG